MSPGSEVLITGAAGFIGRHTVQAFHEAGYQITAVDLRERTNHLAGVARWVRSDFAAADILAEIAAGRYVTVVHQGGISDTRTPAGRELKEINTLGPLRFADACRRHPEHTVLGRSACIMEAFNGDSRC